MDKKTNRTGDISRLVDDLSNNLVLFYLFQASVDKKTNRTGDISRLVDDLSNNHVLYLHVF